MAKKRMFSLDVIDTDKFLDMPLTAQCLYFHLGMRADDDGFIDSPKRMLKYIGSNNDDFKLLVAKGYLIPFNSGVFVIADWKKNNYIQKDRYNPTVYKDELECLSVLDGSYLLKEECIQNVYKADAQVRLDKSKDNISISKEILNTKKEKVPYQEIVDLYNNICVSLSKVRNLSSMRKKAIKARYNQYSIDDFKKLFEMAEGSSFLKGGNDRNWTANFDWLIKDANMAKVLDGNYEDRAQQSNKHHTGSKKPYQQFNQRDYSKSEMDELERALLQNGSRG